MSEPLQKKTILSRAQNFYARIEGPFSSLSLIAGFVFDAITLTRVDQFWENFWVVGHLAIVTVCALLIHLIENEPGAEENPAKVHFWLVNVMQFFFGGIFSTFLVFYFRSGTIVSSWPFLLLLAIAFIVNERFKRHYARLAFQLSLIFLSYYAFAIYVLPILFHEISDWVFLLSGVVALAAIGAFVGILKKFSRERFSGKTKWISSLAIAGIFIAVNVLYFENLIPPLPISLKDAAIYQSLTVNAPGNYTVQAEDQGWFSFFEWSPTIHVQPGETLYAYTAIFSPTAFSANVIHEWQMYDAAKKAWITESRVVLPTAGGGSGGWRTFSLIENPGAGAWRVNVTLPTGQLVGQLRFNIVITTSTPQLVTQDID
ncbi:MAG TPA: DUF2914 domain-containing protein [Candidatus Paceibacterota bacterium]